MVWGEFVRYCCRVVVWAMGVHSTIAYTWCATDLQYHEPHWLSARDGHVCMHTLYLIQFLLMIKMCAASPYDKYYAYIYSIIDPAFGSVCKLY